MRIAFSRPVKATMAGSMYACTQEAHAWLVPELSGIAKTVYDFSRCFLDGWSCSLPHSHPPVSRYRDKKLVLCMMYLRVIQSHRGVHFRCTLNYWRPENNFALKSFRASVGASKGFVRECKCFYWLPRFFSTKHCLAEVRAIIVNYIDWISIYWPENKETVDGEKTKTNGGQIYIYLNGKLN